VGHSLAPRRVCCAHTAAPPQSEPGDLVGDVNCDQRMDAKDVLLVFQFNAGLLRTLPCPQNADVDTNRRITSVDALLMLQRIAGLIPA